jgi:hypothetical protein
MTILTVGLHRFGDASIVVRPRRPEVASRITSQLRQSLPGTTAVRELLTTTPTIFKLAVSYDFGLRQTERSRSSLGFVERRGGRVVEGTRLLIWRTG